MTQSSLTSLMNCSTCNFFQVSAENTKCQCSAANTVKEAKSIVTQHLPH